MNASESPSHAPTVVCDTSDAGHGAAEPGGSETRRQLLEPSEGRPRSAQSFVGQTLGDYRVLARLGSGGMGTVYLAEHRIVGNLVALKVLHPYLATQRQHAERFRNEARMLDRVGHENIVSVFGLFSPTHDRLFLAMELLEGRSLQAILGAPLAPAKLLPILLQICDALEAAHAVGVTHRDLKPDNVLLVSEDDDAPQIRLVDFGIALLAGRSSDTIAKGIAGTPEYMAPEQWDEKPADGRTDLYALGAIAYAMATGSPPFTGRSPIELYRAHRLEQPVPPRERGAAISPGLEAIILELLAKRPEERFQSAAEVRSALEAELRALRPHPRRQDADREEAAARELLGRASRVAPGDHYGMLGVAASAECAQVRRQARRAAAGLQRLAGQLPASEREAAEVALERVHAAAAVLGEPAWRAAFDAEHGNFRGVAQCLGSGLAVERLAGLQKNYLGLYPERDEKARAHFAEAEQAAREGRLEAALAGYELALGLDPLDFVAHERYWPLARERR